MKANEVLKAALGHMEDRAATYDKPEGERSMPATVSAFNALTGHQLTAEQGWLFMTVLKLCRTQQGGFRADNYEDGAAYFALMGEQAAGDRQFGEKLITACEQVNEQITEEAVIDAFVADLRVPSSTATGRITASPDKTADRSAGYGPCDEDGWYDWNTKLSIPRGQVEIRTRAGGTKKGEGSLFDWSINEENLCDWDIVEWRWAVTKPEQDPYGPRDAEGWYAWNGDETMRPAGQVDYIMRDALQYGCHSGPCGAEYLRWNHDAIGGDIVKWRPAQ